MNFLKKYKYILFAVSFLFVVLLFAKLHSSLTDYYLKEISEVNFIKTKLYISERGFGSDRFDIYSFYLLDKKEIPNFKTLDNAYFYKYKPIFFTNLISFDDPQFEISKDIVQQLEKNKDTKYLFFEEENIRKLYLYSSSSNQGYCLILII